MKTPILPSGETRTTVKRESDRKPASFAVTAREHRIIHEIAEMAVRAAQDYGFDYNLLDATMDLTACHANGMKLNLEKLLNAPEEDFCHDVFGIRRYIDRFTGKIDGCFVPRCASLANP